MAVADHFRAFARAPVNFVARIELTDGSWQHDVKVSNLGLGGACLEAPEALAPGTRLRMKLSAPHLWDPLELDAHIAWSREAQRASPACIGLRFDPNSGKTLRYLIELLEPENYEG